MAPLAVSASDVAAAAERLRGHIVRTPTWASRTLSEITGAEVVVKFENLQFTGSFKDRGAGNRLLTLDPVTAARGVIAVSAGNHAQGVAHHAGRLGIPATIVMPTSAPFTKVTRTAHHGAEVVQHGLTLADAAAEADRLAAVHDLTAIPPYDDAAVIAGQGTVAIELLEDRPDIDAIVVPTGGGGLLAGICAHVAGHRPDIDVIGVQTEVYPGMVAALEGRTVEPGAADTLADGIAVKTPGTLTVPIVRALAADVITVPEVAIEHAVALYLEIEKTVAEGAGAASLAAVLHHRDRFSGRRVGLILSGGNIDTRVLASVLMRELVHTGRISTLRIGLPDRPGSLAPVLAAIAAHGANVLEIDHRRLFDPISARRTNVDVVVETRDRAHTRVLIEALEAAGHPVESQS